MFIFQITKPSDVAWHVNLAQVDIIGKKPSFWGDLGKGMIPVYGTIREIGKAIRAGKAHEKGLMWMYVGTSLLSLASDVLLVVGVGAAMKGGTFLARASAKLGSETIISASEKSSLTSISRGITRFFTSASKEAAEEASKKQVARLAEKVGTYVAHEENDIVANALVKGTKAAGTATEKLVETASNGLQSVVAEVAIMPSLQKQAVEIGLKAATDDPRIGAYIISGLEKGAKNSAPVALKEAADEFIKPIYRTAIREAERDANVFASKEIATTSVKIADDAATSVTRQSNILASIADKTGKEYKDAMKVYINLVKASETASEDAAKALTRANGLLLNTADDLAKAELKAMTAFDITETITSSYVRILSKNVTDIGLNLVATYPKVPVIISQPIKLIKPTAPVGAEAATRSKVLGRIILNAGKIPVNFALNSPTTTKSIVVSIAQEIGYPKPEAAWKRAALRHIQDELSAHADSLNLDFSGRALKGAAKKIFESTTQRANCEVELKDGRTVYLLFSTHVSDNQSSLQIVSKKDFDAKKVADAQAQAAEKAATARADSISRVQEAYVMQTSTQKTTVVNNVTYSNFALSKTSAVIGDNIKFMLSSNINAGEINAKLIQTGTVSGAVNVTFKKNANGVFECILPVQISGEFAYDFEINGTRINAGLKLSVVK